MRSAAWLPLIASRRPSDRLAESALRRPPVWLPRVASPRPGRLAQCLARKRVPASWWAAPVLVPVQWQQSPALTRDPSFQAHLA